MAVERLQKVLARAGIASRRAAEALITSGRVRVDGRIVTELGTKVDARRARIEVDGKRIVRERFVYIVLHKPRAVISTVSDPEGRPTVRELLRAIPERIYPIGRLDFHTSGALLLTNDGDLTEALLHPRRAVPKVYIAKVRGLVPEKALEHLRKGVELPPANDEEAMDGSREPERSAPADIALLREENGATWLRVVLTEGRNRQVHRMFEAIGYDVGRLARESFAGITTQGLRPGQWRELTDDELTQLRKSYLPGGQGVTATLTPMRGANERGSRHEASRGAAKPRGGPRERGGGAPTDSRAASRTEGPRGTARGTEPRPNGRTDSHRSDSRRSDARKNGPPGSSDSRRKQPRGGSAGRPPRRGSR